MLETILIITASYILNIFIGRYLNIKMLKYGYPIIPRLWFTPLVSIIAQLVILFQESELKLFKGKTPQNRFLKWFFLE